MSKRKNLDGPTCAYCGGARHNGMIQFWDRNLQAFDYTHKHCRPEQPEIKREQAVRQLLVDLL
jgi:hypothetical protein